MPKTTLLWRGHMLPLLPLLLPLLLLLPTTLSLLQDAAYNGQTVRCTTADGAEGRCSLLVQCTTFFADLAHLSRSPCSISPYQWGVCCPTARARPRDPSTMVSAPTPPLAQRPPLTAADIDGGCREAMAAQWRREQFEIFLVANNIVASPSSLAHQHARLFLSNPDIVRRGRDAAVVLAATGMMKDQLQLTSHQATFAMPQLSVRGTILEGACPPTPACGGPSPYRTVDGSCNNHAHPSWGSAGSSFVRLLPPRYSDGVSNPRRGVDGTQLPSARSVSVATVSEADNVYEDFTLFVMQWGQFLDHDITHTPLNKGSNDAVISCCNAGTLRPPEHLHPECLPIAIPPNDRFYARFGQRCMNFVRSLVAMRPDCSFGPREQMNQITSFIDASNVYGSTAEEQRDLRAFRGGLLKTTLRGRRQLLPANHEDQDCESPALDRPCFAAGDSRVNEQPNLTALHTVWLRQHNLLATRLGELNPGWNDETLFQETRRIVGAQMQHITYNEYLPIVLGRHFVETFRLTPEKEGYSNSYDPSVDPTISNAFATAAFRYGHTLIDSNVQGFSRFGTKEMKMKLREAQFSPFFLYDKGAQDSLIRGLTLQASQKFDNFFSEELTNHLFARNNSFGMDLVALNLQRGRDHGLPPYAAWRSFCKLPPARHFGDLRDVMAGQASQHLSQLYRSVEDIDLFMGAILEHPVAGALVGHTFLCILGDQFYRLKAGDRFYYENGGQASSFSPAQLQEIRKTSLARVLCDTADDMAVIQPLAFLHGHHTNKRVSCNQNIIPALDLAPWRR